MHLNYPIDTCGDNSCTTSDRYVKILDLREGNEESSEETTGCKVSVYEEFDDCPRVEKYVKLFDFRHFERFFRFDLKYTHRNGHRVFKISYFLDIDN